MFLFLQTIFLSVVRTPIHTHIHTTHTVFSHFHSYLLFLFLFSPFLFIFSSFTRLLLNYRFLFFLVSRVSGICFINAYSMSHGILSMQRKNKKFADFYDHVYNVSKMRDVINWRLLLLLYSAFSRQINLFFFVKEKMTDKILLIK